MQDWTHWGQVFYDPLHVSSQPQGDFMLSGSPSGRGNSPRLAALLPFGKWNFDLAKSTVRTLIQCDLGLPWGNLAQTACKCFWLEQSLSCLRIFLKGSRWDCERIGHSESNYHRVGYYGKREVHRPVYESEFKHSIFFFLFFFPWFLLACLLSFEELVLLTSAGTDSH